DRSTCYFCRGQAPGEIYDFYAGFCIDYQRKRAFLSNTVHIRATYRDLKRYGVHVCDNCAAQKRLKRHLPTLIGWGLVAVGCAGGAVYAAVTQVAGDQTIYLLGVFGLFGGLGGLLAVLAGWELFSTHSSPAVTIALLEELKHDPRWVKKGDSFFGPEEYKVLFKQTAD